jgi:hypothetical protein
MSIVDSLRKGFRFFLMSMGVSTYSRKSLNEPAAKLPEPLPPPHKPK